MGNPQKQMCRCARDAVESYHLSFIFNFLPGASCPMHILHIHCTLFNVPALNVAPADTSLLSSTNANSSSPSPFILTILYTFLQLCLYLLFCHAMFSSILLLLASIFVQAFASYNIVQDYSGDAFYQNFDFVSASSQQKAGCLTKQSSQILTQQKVMFSSRHSKLPILQVLLDSFKARTPTPKPSL